MTLYPCAGCRKPMTVDTNSLCDNCLQDYKWLVRQRESSMLPTCHPTSIKIEKLQNEIMDLKEQLAAATREQHICRPNGFGLCQTHPSCGHVKESLKESQEKVTALQNVSRKQHADAERMQKEIDAVRNSYAKSHQEIYGPEGYRVRLQNLEREIEHESTGCARAMEANVHHYDENQKLKAELAKANQDVIEMAESCGRHAQACEEAAARKMEPLKFTEVRNMTFCDTPAELAATALSKIYCAAAEKKPTVTLFTCEAEALAGRSDRLDRWRGTIRDALGLMRLGCKTSVEIKLEGLLGESH